MIHNPVSFIGQKILGGTSGSILFVDSNNLLAQNNSTLYWDNTYKRVGIGTNTFDTIYQKLFISGNDGTGNGVVMTVKNINNTANSFAVYEMSVGTGTKGGKFFASMAENPAYGIVNGISFRASTGQDVGFSVLGATGARVHVQGSTGDVGIRTYNSSTLTYPTYLADLTVGSANASQPSTAGALRPTLRLLGRSVIATTDVSILRLVREANPGNYYGGAAEWKMKTYGSPGTPFLPKTQLTLSLKSTASYTETCDVGVMAWRDNGNVGIGEMAPTAYLHLKAGTATAGTAPLKFTSGTNLTAAEAGAVEFNGTDLFYTNSTPTRNTVANLNQAQTFTGDKTFTGRAILPMAELSYFSITGTAIAISAQSDGSTNMVACNPTTTLDNDSGFDNGGANNGRLRYTGATTKMFHVACTISFSPDAANDTFVMGIAKNGVTMTDCKVLQKVVTAGDTQSTALHCMVQLATNDYIELYVGNTTDTDDFVIKSLNLFAMGM